MFYTSEEHGLTITEYLTCDNFCTIIIIRISFPKI